jgi:nitrite reductase/ring-hydroxylating ferredoxin subunit
MALIKVAKTSDLGESDLIEVVVDGNPYAICKVAGKIYALNGVCPHQGGPLGQGILTGTSIMCPWHAWNFDCKTGVNDVEPDEKVETYRVEVQGTDVLIDIA